MRTKQISERKLRDKCPQEQTVNPVTTYEPDGNDYLSGATNYLREKGLLIDSPYTVPNMAPLERIEVSTFHVTPQSYYKVKGEKVFCHLCGAHRHNLGMVGALPDGTAILFGSACAKEYFGADIWSKMETLQESNIERANEEYRGRWIRDHIGRTTKWLELNDHLVRGLADAWRALKTHHESMTEELISAIIKNRGKLIETKDVFASQSAQHAGVSGRAFSLTNIIISLPSVDGAAAIDHIESHLKSVRRLCESVRNTTHPSIDDFSNWDKYLSSTIRASAKLIDAYIDFSVAIFANGNLEICGDWLDRRRVERLGDHDNITPRRASEILRRRVGYGFELPKDRLGDALPDFSLGRTLGRNAAKIFMQGG